MDMNFIEKVKLETSALSETYRFPYISVSHVVCPSQWIWFGRGNGFYGSQWALQ